MRERSNALVVYMFVNAGVGVSGIVRWRDKGLARVALGVSHQHRLWRRSLRPCIRAFSSNGWSPLQVCLRLDVGGIASVTVALVLAMYAIIGANHAGWGSAQTISALVVACGLMGAFILSRLELRHP